ncbi:hypothetical protein COU76_01240 [Candidatus Peregrinibacteria bacterium CG10_big_fil_rev_8_21_14_0_10_49_10]|nr:MAG: hypothetical protein COU76_01240 [Candidatus Peregrinibacteria bacterium CG10_big_fil_rev_8_21_14_0_10_49_10]
MSGCPTNPKGIVALLLRISFGLSLLFVGLTHYMTMGAFKGMTMDGLGALEPLGALWAYILPALMIVGGALLTIGMYTEVAVWASGVALGSIPIGMLLKPVVGGVPLPNVMPAVINAFIWIIVLVLVVKTSCCCSEE